MLAEVDWTAVLTLPNIVIIMGFLIPIVAIVCWAWASIHKTRSANNLKRTLAERGMSAAEIERVVSAKGPQC